MNHSPAQIIEKYLVDVGIFDNSNWFLFIGSLPPSEEGKSPIRAAAVYDTTGLLDGRLMESGEVIKHPGFQIKLRSDNYELGWKKLSDAGDSLSLINNTTVIVDTSTYIVENVSATADITALGPEQGSTRYQLFVSNFILTVNLEDES